jgi:polyisoprenyl-teichoic acid--peptidoglycan teichoic acid transferase
MSTFNQSGRRSLDGPVRRMSVPPLNPLASQPDSLVPPIAPATEGPVFEYRKPRRMRGGWWRGARWAAVAMVVLVLGTVGWFGYKGLNAARKIIAHSNGVAPALAGVLDPTKLKGEGDGRVNILVLGIGGPGHDGANLSDTIMVMSLDPQTKDVAMLSVPRDLYVKLPPVARYSTQYSKINAANAYGGPEYAAKVVSGVIGVPIHYYVLVDFSGFKQAIDAVGGIDINVPAKLYDPEFPCDNDRGYCPLSIAAGQQHMNGTVALRYARCRHGICGGDFGRAARQQQVLVALREKAMQASTLTNPVKLTGLIDAIGSHVKTDMQINEIKKLASVAKDINTSKITNKVLDTTGDASLLIDGTGMIPGAGSIELPRAGNFDYSDIQDFVKNIFIDHYITDEKASIEVQNGSGVPGLAGTVVKSLLAAHYNVGDPQNATDHYTQTVIYDYTGGKKPYTINYLERRFGVKANRVAAPLPSTDATGKQIPAPEIRIILGSDYKSATSAQ